MMVTCLGRSDHNEWLLGAVRYIWVVAKMLGGSLLPIIISFSGKHEWPTRIIFRVNKHFICIVIMYLETTDTKIGICKIGLFYHLYVTTSYFFNRMLVDTNLPARWLQCNGVMSNPLL